MVNLSAEMAEFVQRKIASGEYVDESEVIAESLELLEDREEGLERWLREEIVPVCLEMEADPSLGVPVEEVQQALAARRNNPSDPNG